jgi:cell wall assembly regulator SMI1
MREIEEWERRLGRQLPPSYRKFLSIHDGWEVYKDGWTLMGAADETFAAARVDAALTLEEYADAWTQTYGEATHEAIARYEAHDSSAICTSSHVIYAANKIAVGTDFNGGVVLLNPTVRDSAGEFEAVRFKARWGAIGRHASFYALLQADLADLGYPAE